VLFIFDFQGLKKNSPLLFLTHPPYPLSLKKRGGISMNFFIFFPLSNSVREGELKGVSQEKPILSKIIKE
jgi:hypothetical protein